MNIFFVSPCISKLKLKYMWHCIYPKIYALYQMTIVLNISWCFSAFPLILSSVHIFTKKICSCFEDLVFFKVALLFLHLRKKALEITNVPITYLKQDQNTQW